MPGRRAGQGRIDAVQIAVLGPLEVRADAGQPVEVGGARLRRLLILLALEPGRVVTTSRLVDGVWEDDRPAGAANELQELVAAHPLREPPIGQLMRALRAAGRPSAALSVFEQARGRLADQLGADP